MPCILSFILALFVNATLSFPSWAAGLEEEGKTAVIVTVDGEAVGVVAVADTDKEVRGLFGLGWFGCELDALALLFVAFCACFSGHFSTDAIT